jgi:hypothetical protein
VTESCGDGLRSQNGAAPFAILRLPLLLFRRRSVPIACATVCDQACLSMCVKECVTKSCVWCSMSVAVTALAAVEARIEVSQAVRC